MVLGIAEDYSTEITLDSQLTSVPESGIYANSGIHPSITVGNLLAFLPKIDIVPSIWDYTKNYGKYETLRSKDALCTRTNNIYQSLKTPNQNQNPVTQTAFWLQTNAESLKLKSFLDKVRDKVYSDLMLTKRLINNQFIYEVGETEINLPNDYCGWVFEPKGSDYVTIKINQISIQKSGTTPISLYVINQGVLVDTLTITPSNGKVAWQDLFYTFKGQGKWHFVIDSTQVISNNGYIDPLQYDGFVAYTCVGIGNSPEGSTYSYGNSGNGLGFNVSVYLDSNTYVENNITQFAPLVRATFEYMAFQMMASNSYNTSELAQRIQQDKKMLQMEILDTNPSVNSSVNRYEKALRQAKDILNKTFDTQLSDDDEGVRVEIGSI